MVDERIVRQTVGNAAFDRALGLVEAGAVLSLADAEDKKGGRRLVASVQGSLRSPYAVVVRVLGEGRSAGFTGTCSCPMRYDCKHVAAVVLVAARAGRRETVRTGPAEPPPRAEWARALRELLPTDAARSSGSTVALQFDLTVGQKDAWRITLRPVVRGQSGRWVRTGVSWTTLTYHQARRESSAAVRLLEELYALSTRRDRYHYYGREEPVLLESFPSPRVWDVLAQAGEAGLPLVCTGAGEAPVLLAREAARVTLDLTDEGEEWRLRPLVTAGPEALEAGHSLLLGDPAHGIAWWEPSGPGGRTGAPLRLARLERALPAGLRTLVARGRDLSVPVAEQAEFLRDYYPVLRHQVTVASVDGSVDLPAERPPRLVLRAAHAADQRVSLRWSWQYAVGEAVREAPLWPAVYLAEHDRESAAESKVLLDVCAVTDAMPELYEAGPAGPRLAAHAELSGADALVGLAVLMVGLAELPDVEVRTTGDAVALRPADGPPVVSLAGEAGGADWFDLAVSVSVDDEPVPFASLFTALALEQRYLLLPSGTYVSLDRPELHKLRALIEEARGLGERADDGTVRVGRFQVDFWQELVGLGVVSAQAAAWTASVRDLAGAEAVTEVDVPASLAGTLRPYQQAGFSWLAYLYDHSLGGVLADDMGLGKTLQAIALLCRIREAAPAGPPFLVVAPTSVVGNWAAEVRRFAPGLSVATISGTKVRRGVPLADVAAGVDVVVTSYALLRLEYEAYSAVEWAGLVLDEAQAVKNHAGKGYQCVRRLPVPFKLAITGTPMENNLMELWAMFSLVAPGLFPDPKRFTEYYRRPIERDADVERLDRLRRRIRPLMMRRTKEEVAADLPAKIEQVVSLELNPRHRRLYDTYLARERQKVLGLLGDLDKHRIAVLTSLTLLRQAALDVALVDPVHAAVPSTKLDTLAEQLTEVVAEGHRVLVFSQFTRFLARVRERLDRDGIGYCYLDGRTRNRAQVVEEFTSGAAPVFLMSIKAGGVGLNLTQADYCILLDPWWNPATEAQAVDRAHRIGQTRNVMVYRLVAKDTIEEKVMALKESKARLFSAIMDGGGAGSTALTADDIRSLLE
jgi:superfamily II DNA or RNA helicase